jgi:hypothetical protein
LNIDSSKRHICISSSMTSMDKFCSSIIIYLVPNDLKKRSNNWIKKLFHQLCLVSANPNISPVSPTDISWQSNPKRSTFVYRSLKTTKRPHIDAVSIPFCKKLPIKYRPLVICAKSLPRFSAWIIPFGKRFRCIS